MSFGKSSVAALRIISFSVIAGLLISSCADSTGPASDAWLKAVASGDHRPADDQQRDKYRHPVATLDYFGLTPESAVVELWPSGGWYTKVIAPAVNEKGQYYAAHFDPDTEIPMLKQSVEKFQALLDSRPDLYGNVKITVLSPPDKLEIAPAGTADLVVSFRSVHNWMAFGMQDDVMQAVAAALKPGGIFGVVEHRGIPGSEQDPQAKSGYVTEAYMISLAEKAGLELVDSSEVNANEADTKDYPDGVWTLPPRLRMGQENRDYYLAIGESDRFTMRFRKPAG